MPHCIQQNAILLDLLSDIPYKNCGMMAEYMEGTSEQALEQFISSASLWDYEKLNCKRIQYMLERSC